MYVAHTVDDKWYIYFVFKDHSEVRFVFPEHMERQVHMLLLEFSL